MKYLRKEKIMDYQKLIELAKDARKLAYTPYSHFPVGAALLTKDDKVYVGANIENASYPLCMCAERNAIYRSYLDGVRKDDIVAIVIVADTPNPCSPCGACRQVMSELLNKDTDVIMINLNDNTKIVKVKDILPFAFSEEDLK